MNDVAQARVTERFGDLLHDLNRLGHRERWTGHPTGKALAFVVSHHQKSLTVVRFLDSVTRSDVLVIERGGGPRLPPESVMIDHVRGIWRKKFQGHSSLQGGIEGLEDRPHAASTNLAEDLIVA